MGTKQTTARVRSTKAPRPTRRQSHGRASEETPATNLLMQTPCPRDGCTLYWPRWHDGQPKCKVCARDESLAALAAQGGLTQEARQGGVVT
jgi:hypothetical protein